MPTDPTAAEQQLKTLLTELLQLDDAARLDFGIYKILALRREELSRFLDTLAGEVRAELEASGARSHEAAKAAVAEFVSSSLKLGWAYDDIYATARHKTLTEQLAGAIEPGQLAQEVFESLVTFFARYWDEGDFIAAPRYSRDQYAIPYDGSEVALHWANRDQYYVKSSLFLNDMVVKEPHFPGRLVIKLVSAVSDRDNVKAADANKRRFMLADDGQPDVVAEGDDLTLRLRYAPTAPPAAAAPPKAKGKKKAEPEAEAPAEPGRAPKQDLLNVVIAEALLAAASPAWRAALSRPAGPEKDAESTLTRHLRRYTKQNTADFFIHKNLGRFLRRELDFFIKNELFDLDHIDTVSEDTLRKRVVKVRALRRLAVKLIDWLHQLEEFQRRLFLKKKFVLRTDWAITLDRVPRALWPEIAQNKAQVRRWRDLFKIDALAPDLFSDGGGEAETVTVEFLEQNVGLVVETGLFERAFRARLSHQINANIDSITTGYIIRSENMSGLQSINKLLAESVQFAYIDPPYNTGSDGFMYKDSYMESSWITMIGNRLGQCLPLLRQTGLLYCSINHIQQSSLHYLLNETFGPQNRVEELIWVQDTVSNNAPMYSTNHEYIEVFAKNANAVLNNDSLFRDNRAGMAEVGVFLETHKDKYLPVDELETILHEMYTQHRLQFRDEARQQGIADDDIASADPWKSIYPYNHIEYRSPTGDYISSHIEARKVGGILRIWREVEPSMPSGKQAASTRDPSSENYRFYSPPNPVHGGFCKPPKRGWAFPQHSIKDRPSFDKYSADHRISFKSDSIPQLKYFLHEVESVIGTSVIRQYADGDPILFSMFGTPGLFSNPKPPRLIERLAKHALPNSDGAYVLDYFAGSGTTGHAVINLNREDGGDRRFVLVEMGDHFDTVLVPRVLKATYSKDWKDGAPVDRKGVSALYKILRLESYDDTLENITLRRDDSSRAVLFDKDGQPTTLGESYLLKYQLALESRASRLQSERFDKPFHATLKALAPRPDGRGGVAVQAVPVDMVETFNLLLGLRARRMWSMTNDGQQALLVSGVVRDGADWTTPVVVLWWDTQDVKEETLVSWLKGLRAREDDVIGPARLRYVNGDASFSRLWAEDEPWTPLEPEFQRRMFDVAEEG